METSYTPPDDSHVAATDVREEEGSHYQCVLLCFLCPSHPPHHWIHCHHGNLPHALPFLYLYLECTCWWLSSPHHCTFIRLMLAASLKHCTVKIDTGESLYRFVVLKRYEWTIHLFMLYISLCRLLCRVLWPQKKWLHPSSRLLLQLMSGMPSKHLVSPHILVATGLMHCR